MYVHTKVKLFFSSVQKISSCQKCTHTSIQSVKNDKIYYLVGTLPGRMHAFVWEKQHATHFQTFIHAFLHTFLSSLSSWHSVGFVGLVWVVNKRTNNTIIKKISKAKRMYVKSMYMFLWVLQDEHSWRDKETTKFTRTVFLYSPRSRSFFFIQFCLQWFMTMIL